MSVYLVSDGTRADLISHEHAEAKARLQFLKRHHAAASLYTFASWNHAADFASDLDYARENATQIEVDTSTVVLPIKFKKEPQGKAFLRLAMLLTQTPESALAVAENGLDNETFGRDVLADLLAHVCETDDDLWAVAFEITVPRVFDFVKARDGRL